MGESTISVPVTQNAVRDRDQSFRTDWTTIARTTTAATAFAASSEPNPQATIAKRPSLNRQRAE